MQSHVVFQEDRVNAFVCNVIDDNLSDYINPSSVDVVTLVRIGNFLKNMALICLSCQFPFTFKHLTC